MGAAAAIVALAACLLPLRVHAAEGDAVVDSVGNLGWIGGGPGQPATKSASALKISARAFIEPGYRSHKTTEVVSSGGSSTRWDTVDKTYLLAFGATAGQEKRLSGLLTLDYGLAGQLSAARRTRTTKTTYTSPSSSSSYDSKDDPVYDVGILAGPELGLSVDVPAGFAVRPFGLVGMTAQVIGLGSDFYSGHRFQYGNALKYGVEVAPKAFPISLAIGRFRWDYKVDLANYNLDPFGTFYPARPYSFVRQRVTFVSLRYRMSF